MKPHETDTISLVAICVMIIIITMIVKNARCGVSFSQDSIRVVADMAYESIR